MGGYTTVVVGTDGSDTSFAAVDRAAALAADSDATLVIVCAFVPARPDPAATDALGEDAYQIVGSAPADDTVSRARDRAQNAGATKIETKAIEGRPSDTLISVSKDVSADLVVVGNRGLNSIKGRIIGSVPMDVIRHSPIDTLIVHTT